MGEERRQAEIEVVVVAVAVGIEGDCKRKREETKDERYGQKEKRETCVEVDNG